jgi:energy-coupling factor transporter transmembrane protein EcfT
MEVEIVIRPKFDVKTTFKATMLVFFSSKNFLYILFILFLLTLSFFGKNIFEEANFFSILQPIFLILCFLSILTYSFYRNSKKQIIDNYRLEENIVYILNNEYFQEKGDSFEIKHFWKNIIKVVEKKEFFFIYVAKNKAIFIRKTDLKDNQYNELKGLLSSLNIKKSLK